MGTIYVDTGGSATACSGTTDAATAPISLTINVAEAFADTTLLVDVTSGTFTDIVTSGATQSAIIFDDATNSNKKIFWISAIDNVASPKTITVDTIPTGLTAGTSVGYVGGQFLWTPAAIEAALRPGDIVIINNSPAAVSGASDWLTTRVSGDSTSGYITVKGKTGVRPVITAGTGSGSGQCVETGAFVLWKFENLEFAQQGTSGNTFTGNNSATGLLLYNIKVSDGGAAGLSLGGAGNKVIASEITGVTTIGISQGNSSNSIFYGNYIHDVTTDGILLSMSAPSVSIINNIIDTAAGRGLNISAAPTASTNIIVLHGNTVYGCGNSGLEIADADSSVVLINNIFSENGNAAGEYNVEWVAGAAEEVGFHAWNVFYHTTSTPAVSGLTLNAMVASSEFSTDPAMTNPAAGDFSIGTSSPAKAAGFPGAFLGAGCTGYLDIGAVQRQEPAAGGGGNRVIGG